MNKIKILTWMVSVLLMLNIVLIWLLLSNHKPGGRREEPKFYIIKTLNFDSEQEKVYEKLIQEHQSRMQNSRHKLMQLKNKLYSTLNDINSSPTSKDSLMAEISREQLKIEQINYSHFKDIKNICKPEQITHFNQLTSELSKLFSPPPPKHVKK